MKRTRRAAELLVLLLLGTTVLTLVSGARGASAWTAAPPSAAVSPEPSPAASAVRLLASVSQSTVLQGSLPVSAVAISMAEDPAGFAWGAGYNVYHANGSSGTWNFTSSNDPDFGHLAAGLTNGVTDGFSMTVSGDSGGGTGMEGPEDAFFHTHPDFFGSAIDWILLIVSNVHMEAGGGWSWAFTNYTWQIWGHPLYVAFRTPTDPNGAIVFDRDWSNVSVHLATAGTTALEWDGANRSMDGGPTNWSLNVTGIPDGVHAFRVWGTNATGVVAGSEVRTITIQDRLWSASPSPGPRATSLAFDPRGGLHACAVDASGELRYLTRGPSGWTGVPVAAGAIANACLLAIDPSGHVSMVYGTGVYGGLEYTQELGGTWPTEPITYAGNATGASLAVNPRTGQPSVAYRSIYTGGIVIGARTGTGWTFTTPGPGSPMGYPPSLVVDAGGYAHLAYFRVLSNFSFSVQLVYATNATGTWVSQVVDQGTQLSTWQDVSLALDANGNPAIAYGTSNGYTWPSGVGALRLATWTGSAWNVTTVDRAPVAAVALALDDLGHPHVAYSVVSFFGPLPDTVSDTRYAVWNGSWSVETLSRDTDGGPVSLRLTQGGQAVIAFPTFTGYYASLAAGSAIAFRAPVADFAVTVPTAPGNTTFVLDPNATMDPFDALGSLQERWDFNSDGVWDTGWGSGPVLLNTTLDPVAVTMEVRTPSGRTDLRTRVLSRDTEPPQIQIVADGLRGNSGWWVGPVTLSLSGSDTGTGVLGIYQRVDEGPWTNATGTIVLGEGVHTVSVTATDRVGNPAPIRTVLVPVDETPPTLAVIGPTATVPSGTVRIDWIGMDNLSGILGYGISVDGEGFLGLGNQTYANVTLGVGDHTVIVQATDRAGNSAEVYLTIRVASSPPPGVPSPPLAAAVPVALLVLALVGIAAIAVAVYVSLRTPRPPPRR